MTDRSLIHLATVRGSRLLSLSLCMVMLSACAIGPDYERPQAADPVQYKAAEGWTQANPSDALIRGAWWELYGDRQLNELVERLNRREPRTVARLISERSVIAEFPERHRFAPHASG